MSQLHDKDGLMSSKQPALAVSLAAWKQAEGSKRRGSMKQSISQLSGFARIKSFWPG